MNLLESQTSLREHQEVFRKLAYFTAPSALGEDGLSESILDNLIEHVLYLKTTAISLSNIQNFIKSQFKLNFEIDEVKLSLDRLVSKSLIIKNRGDFSLEIRHRDQLKKLVNEKIEHERQIFQKLTERIKGQYSELTQEMIAHIRDDFQLFLTNFFLLSGAEAVQLIYGNPKEISEIISKVEKKNIFDLLPIRNETIKKIEQKEFCEFVNLLSDQEKIYLQDLLDRSLQYFTITVDKKCEAFLTADFVNWNLFVDTNFIYNLLGLNIGFSGSKRKNTEKILELCKKASIKFFVSPVTLEEFTMSVSRARELLLGDQISRKLYKIAGDVTGNAILSAYYGAYEEHNISPKDFLAKTDNIKDVLREYGIDEKTDYSQSIKETKEFVETVNKLISLTGKEKNVAEHDAFHYLLILKLRSREGANNTFRTNKSWFLTHDGLLAPFDRENRKSEIPFCIRPYQLRQILRPLFSRTDDFESVFIDFITEPTSRAFPVISTEIVMKVLARVTYFEKEFSVQNSPELATKILTNQHFINQLRELREDEDKQVKLIDKELKQVAQVSDEEVEKKTQQSNISIPKNYWNFVNPFWLIWKSFQFIVGKFGHILKIDWHQTWWGQLVIGLIVTVIGGLIIALIL
ncbi:MAG: hypothetical protein V1484_02800 [bacterium]